MDLDFFLNIKINTNQSINDWRERQGTPVGGGGEGCCMENTRINMKMIWLTNVVCIKKRAWKNRHLGIGK